MRPALVLARRAVLRSLAAFAIVVPTTVLISAVDRGGDAWPPLTVAWLCGPCCVAMGTAWALAELRSEGAWDAALGLGHSRPRLLSGVWAAALTLALASLAASGPAASTGISEVAPIPTEVTRWWSGEDWAPVDPAWTRSPARLGTIELVTRLRSPAPPGSAWRVDRGELVRRVGWAVGFFWAGIAGGGCGVVAARGRRARTDAVILAAGAAFALVALWLVAVLAASAYASAAVSMT